MAAEITIHAVRVEHHGILRAFVKPEQAAQYADRVGGEVVPVTLQEGQSVRVWSHTWEKRGKIVGFVGRSKVKVEVPLAKGSKVQSFPSAEVVFWNK
jgi:hypothetical protein